MDSQGGPGMPRRGFLAAALAGVTSVVLAACTAPSPTPTPTPSATPTPSPTPTPTPTPLPPGVPEPTAMRRSAWGTDPYARGAFSFDAIGTTAERRAQLARPVLDRVFFAGEAVATEAPGTVAGALASGRDVARRVAQVAEPGERIAIIGAGIAGLAAANELRGRRAGRDDPEADDAEAEDAERSDAPDFEVVVIEARDRVGGRIQSVDDDAFGGSIELGALFLPGGDPGGDPGDDPAGTVDGALDELLDEASVDTRDLTPPTDARTVGGVWAPIQPTGAEALAAAHAWAQTWPFDVGLDTALLGSGADQLSSEPGTDGVAPVDWLGYALMSGVEPVTGARPSLVSAQTFDPASAIPPARFVTGRLSDVIDELAASVDVALSSVVTSIAYTADRVSLRMGTGESLRVDRVIVTVPLGVLQTDTIEFSPRLPRPHQQAIAVLGMGTVDLVWLRFDDAFWRADATDEQAAQEVLTVVGGPGTVAAWVDVGLAGRGDEPVLVGIIAAEQARRLEELSDDEFRAEVLADLVPFAPEPTTDDSATPEPT
ncbi:flavin monoamine oxidase family protein [Agromyces aerolatus]|uniref:flavin monoamine oxidase family protein n=1 Tax=Agromyces sp. LY-1074 TaxID=3074080 RepID=UPI00285E02DF|nr:MULTISPECIES: FAD-dependent oxidoreductase [unclassified Agromyces]MDR5701230.1 FAD-dependent oxidoreductase [Agromyces sp. LY-1074]MDR5706894.1 FAD-dependent oxidoreductase [Agromyces sp. LY-1358]